MNTFYAQILDWRRKFPSPKARLPKNLAFELDAIDIPGFETRAEKLFAIVNGLTVRPTCVVCGGHVKYGKQGRFFETCSLSCAAKNPKTREKTKKTNLNKFGVAHPLQSAQVQAKLQETNQQRYGSKNPAASPEVKEKIAITNTTKYGNICSLNGEEVIRKKRHTWLSTRGVDNPAKCPDVKLRAAQTVLKKTNTRKQSYLALFAHHGITPLFNEWTGTHQYEWKHECGTVFRAPFTSNYIPRCPHCFPLSISKEELAVRQMLEKSGVEFQTNVRSVLNGRELDIYIPSKNIGIEINGAYWHHDGRDYLFTLHQKTELAEQIGIHLLHFWDFEVNEKPEIVKSIIFSKLGLLPITGARKFTVQKISPSQAADFLNNTHINGFARAKYHFALMRADKIHAVASFGRTRFERTDGFELIRFASTNTIAGGLSKLIAAFKKHETGRLITYADRRFSIGNAYKKIGFRFLKNTKPNYFYFRGSKRIQRQQAQRHRISNLGITKLAESELDTMLINGWLKCSDCGSKKFELDI